MRSTTCGCSRPLSECLATIFSVQRRTILNNNFRVSVAVCLGLLLFAGCQGNENSRTGTSSGTRFLSGEVQMVGNLAGVSPAGLSVMAQGQVATTDSAGRFAFMSLSDGN